MFPDKSINRRIALASTFGAVGLFLSSRLDFGVSLKDLTANAVPYEVVRLPSSALLVVLVKVGRLKQHKQIENK